MGELSELCRRQQGIITRQQALACGMTAAQVRARLRGDRWRRLFPGVYATFTGVVPRESRCWAAVLAAGPGAVCSHQTAAELAGFGHGNQAGGTIHVTVPPGRRVRRLPGVVVHISARALIACHPTRLPPQTRVVETALDLTQTAPDLETALDWVIRVCACRLTTVDRLRNALGQRKKVRWRPELSEVLADVHAGCHSLLELRYLRNVERRHRLPAGVRQRPRSRPGGRWYDDVCYSSYRTTVELDGSAAHPPQERSRDRRRDNATAVAGGHVLRYGMADVVDYACAVAADVAAVLRNNGWSGDATPCGPGCAVAPRRDRGRQP